MYFPVVLILISILPPSLGNETKLNTHLQKITNKFARPVINHSSPVVVTFGFELVHIVSITENEQSFKAKVWLRMSWVNELMQWNPTEWDNVTVTRMNYATVWTPDIFLEQDVSEEISTGPEKYKTQVSCQYNGKHQWYIPALYTTSCHFDVTNFPYDRQKCHLKFLSWSYTQKELTINIDPRPVITSNYVVSAEWKLLQVTHKVNIKKYECCPDPYVDVVYTINIDRRAMYYMYNAVLPCIIQMIIILFTFFLPPDSGERIGVVITVLLVFAVYLDMISGDLPKTSNSVPALSTFYIASMAASSCSLVATCFTLIVHFKGAEKGITPMPNWVKNLFLEKIGRFAGIGKLLRKYSNSDLLSLAQLQNVDFGGFAVVPQDYGPMDSEDKKETIIYSRRGTHNSLYEEVLTNSMYYNKKRDPMSEIIAEVRVITKLIHVQNLQDEIEEEWQTLAKVMDRIFFVIFATVFIGFSLALLLPVYSHQTAGHTD